MEVERTAYIPIDGRRFSTSTSPELTKQENEQNKKKENGKILAICVLAEPSPASGRRSAFHSSRVAGHCGSG
jgi:hypothetical protein